MRWGIETAYETLKSRLQLENFTGTKPILLLQDIKEIGIDKSVIAMSLSGWKISYHVKDAKNCD